ncbi:MAG: FAD:protein FMN transferase [Eubacterium sp.]|nr:FAD:protein FMN transferase [Eubacterium sp.]
MHFTSLTHKKSFLTLILLLLVSALSSCTPRTVRDPLTKSGFYFDTIITITVYNTTDESLLDGCFAIADTYEQLFSATIPDSEISQINQSDGRPVTVSSDTLSLLQTGLKYCELSKGGFDISIGKLSSLWNFTEENSSLPDADAIHKAVSTVDYRNILISGNEVTLKNPDTAIDLGAIAKGYIADQMKEYLNEHGVTEGTINLGGNVLCIGPKSDGSNYRIGIQMPFEEQGAIAAVVEVKDQTVVSSGVYERYMTVNDKLYHHILNPKTGYPYENGLLGVSIICPKSQDGDGLSTACFSLGLEDGMKLIESLSDTEAIFITEDYEFHCSSGIGDTIPFEKGLAVNTVF